MVATVMNRVAMPGHFSPELISELELLFLEVEALASFNLEKANRLVNRARNLAEDGERSFQTYRVLGQVWHQKEVLTDMCRRADGVTQDLIAMARDLWSELDELAVANSWREELSELPQRCERTAQAIRMRAAQFERLITETAKVHAMLDSVTAARPVAAAS